MGRRLWHHALSHAPVDPRQPMVGVLFAAGLTSGQALGCRRPVRAFVELTRNTPTLVQLMFASSFSTPACPKASAARRTIRSRLSSGWWPWSGCTSPPSMPKRSAPGSRRCRRPRWKRRTPSASAAPDPALRRSSPRLAGIAAGDRQQPHQPREVDDGRVRRSRSARSPMPRSWSGRSATTSVELMIVILLFFGLINLYCRRPAGGWSAGSPSRATAYERPPVAPSRAGAGHLAARPWHRLHGTRRLLASSGALADPTLGARTCSTGCPISARAS